MSEKKMTKRALYEELLGIVTEQRHIDFINHELELLARKNSSGKGLTATQKQNNDLKLIVLDSMEPGKQYTVTELLGVVDFGEVVVSFNKLSSLIKQLKDSGLVTRIEGEKKKIYFVKA